MLVFFRERVFSSSTGSGNRVFSDTYMSILINAFEDPRQRGRSIHSAPRMFWSVDRSPALYRSLCCGLCVDTLLRYAFSAIWPFGSFLPSWGEMPNGRPSRCPPIVTSVGLWSPRSSWTLCPRRLRCAPVSP